MSYKALKVRIALICLMSIPRPSTSTVISDLQIESCKRSFPAYMRTLEHQIKWAERSLNILGERITLAAARRLYNRTATAAEITFASSYFSRHKKNGRPRIIQAINHSAIMYQFIKTLFDLEPVERPWTEHEFKRLAHAHVLKALNLDPHVSFEHFMELSTHRNYLSDESHELILAHAIFALHCFEQTRIR